MRFSTSSIVQGLALGLFVTQAVAAPKNLNHPTYDSLMKRDPTVRSEILRRADPAAHAQVWVDRVENYRNTHADTLTPEQSTVLDNAVNMLNDGDKSVLQQLKDDAISAFGFDEAKSIATTLDGTSAPKRDVLMGRAPLCECATVDDWCADGYTCKDSGSCSDYPDSCGWWNSEKCDGLCYG